MLQTIIFGIVLVVVFFTRKIWGKYLVLLFKKKQQTRELSGELSDGQVFSPRGTIRTFNIAFDIQEMGDGTAKITLAKIKAQEL